MQLCAVLETPRRRGGAPSSSLPLPPSLFLPPALPHPFSPTFSGRIIKRSPGMLMLMPSLPSFAPFLYYANITPDWEERSPSNGFLGLSFEFFYS